MSEFKDMISGDKPTLVDFFCHLVRTMQDARSYTRATQAENWRRGQYHKIDVDRAPDLSAEYQIRSVPTLIIFKNGEPQWRASGLQQLEVLEDKLRIQMQPGK